MVNIFYDLKHHVHIFTNIKGQFKTKKTNMIQKKFI